MSSRTPPIASGANAGRITDRIRVAMPALSQSHARVARIVLGSPERVTHLSTAQLAAEAGVSQPTVTRFCQQLGLGTYHALLLALAEEVGREHATAETSAVLEGIGPDDSLDHVVQTLTRLDVEAMELAARQLDQHTLEDVAVRVAGARQVDVYGVGASALIAHELELRLFRIGVPIRAWTEVHAAETSAALRRPGDVAIAISASGRTRETFDSMIAARDHGATAVAVTSDPRSPLAQAADLHLTAAGSETAYRTASFSARHAQLLVLDILYIRVAQLDHDRAAQSVEATSHIARNTRIREHRHTSKDTP